MGFSERLIDIACWSANAQNDFVGFTPDARFFMTAKGAPRGCCCRYSPTCGSVSIAPAYRPAYGPVDVACPHCAAKAIEAVVGYAFFLFCLELDDDRHWAKNLVLRHAHIVEADVAKQGWPPKASFKFALGDAFAAAQHGGPFGLGLRNAKLDGLEVRFVNLHAHLCVGIIATP